MATPTQALKVVGVQPIAAVTDGMSVMHEGRFVEPAIRKAYLTQRLLIQLLFPQRPPRFAVVEALAVLIPPVFVVILVGFRVSHGRCSVRRAISFLRKVRTAGMPARQQGLTGHIGFLL
jgi:hypothetical protein